VGASLLAKAADQSTFSSQEVRFREQARSHSGLFRSPVLCSSKKLVGASLLAMAVGQLTFLLKGDRYREQAHSYKDLCSAGHDGHPHRPRFWGMTPFPRWPKT
jgi:hypothetical protein